MNPLKLKLLEELMEHMKSREAGGLKGMLEASKAPPEGTSMEEKMESPEEEALEEAMGEGDKDKPKGIEIEKVSLMAKPKIPGISMGKHRTMFPGPKDGDLQALIDKKTGKGMDHESPSEEDSEMTDEELKELMSKYGM